jgi:glycosyltransferase involved in cell wall biosynthesis
MTVPAAVILAHYHGYLLQFRGAVIRELVRRGYRTVVAVPGLSERIRAGLSDLGAEAVAMDLSRTGMNPFEDLSYHRRVGAFLRRNRPELVIATGIKPILYGIPQALAAGVATRVSLFAGLGALLRPENMRHRALGALVDPLVRRSLRSATHVVTQNPDDAAVLSSRFGQSLRVPPLVTAGSGVDLEHFLPSPSPDRRRILMLARIIPEKGVREFIGAAQIVRGADPSVSFALAGFFESSSRGFSREWLRSACREAGVEYLGHADDARVLIRESSMLVLPSYGEGRPRTVQEALAMGRPVVTTDSPGCRDAIEHGVHGRIVPVGDAPALARAILELLPVVADPELARTCREFAKSRYCASGIATDLLDRVGVTRVDSRHGVSP